MVKDALQRKWQLGTIQVDYNLPERFELEYTAADGEKHRPVMIHRAPFGSIERFIAVLLEHCGGEFPLWLHPEPIVILPISEKYQLYAEKIVHLLNDHQLVAKVDERNEKIGKKIRDAEMQKTPFMLIVGETEQNLEQVAVRKHKNGAIGTMSLIDFVSMIKEDIVPVG
jgi:threonyl-tRNA synthetase